MVSDKINKTVFTRLRSEIVVPLNEFVEWDRYGIREDDSGFIFGWIKRDDGFYDFVAVNFKMVYGDFLIGFNTSSKKYSKEISKRLNCGEDSYSECTPAKDIPEARLVKWQKDISESINTG